MKIKEIIESCSRIKLISVDIQGYASIDIDGLNLCNRKTSMKSILSFVVNEKYSDIIKLASHVKALLVSKENVDVYKQMVEERGDV